MKRYDPRHLSDTLRASSSSETPVGVEPPDAPAPQPVLTMEKSESLREPARIVVPTPPTEALRENVLPCIEGSVLIDTVPEGASLRFLKKIFQRILRVATRRQVDFNFNTAYVLRVLSEHAGQLNQTVDQIVRQLGPLESRLDEKISSLQQTTGKIWESFNEKLEEIRSEQRRSTRLLQERMDQVQAFAQQLGGDTERRFQDIYRGQEDLQKTQKQLIGDTENRFQEVYRTQEGLQKTQKQLIGDTERRFQEIYRTQEGIQNTQEHLTASQDSVRHDLEMHLRAIQETIAHVRSSQHRIVRAFRSELASAGNALSSTPQPDAASPSSSPAGEESAFLEDLTYQLYEDRWRGSVEAIRVGQMEYIEILRSHLQALSCAGRMVLDVGCGRGEFLRLLQEQGFAAKGVEINRAFVTSARECGLDVEREDALAWLRRQADDALAAVVAFQVLEHFPPAVLRQFLDLVQAKLAPGGVALFETLNPGTFAAFRWYLMDLTHERFLSPDTTRFLCECAGLEHLETRLIHPVDEWERLTETGDATERENLRRLNTTLYGPQDYFILVRKPLDDNPLGKGENGA